MLLQFRKFYLLFVALFLVSIIGSAYMLFMLPDHLMHDASVLDLDEAERASHLFTRLYLVIGITFVLGIISVIAALQSQTGNIVYVEKEKEELDKMKADAAAKEEKEQQLDMGFVQKVVKEEKSEEALLRNYLVALCKQLDAGQGAIYVPEITEEGRYVKLVTGYALAMAESNTLRFEFGEGLVGQAAMDTRTFVINDVPEGYIKVVSGLGSATPGHLVIATASHNQSLAGVIEIAAFHPFNKKEVELVEKSFAEIMKALGGETTQAKTKK
jgi:putative methionine-R-sulfoxide reductase with GAF domain